MHVSRTVVDRTLQILSWALWTSWGALLVGSIFTTFIEDNYLGDLPGFMWIMFALTISNTLASAVGAIYILFTRQARELRVTWLLSFFFALFVVCNVALVPLFRHYVLRQPFPFHPSPDPLLPEGLGLSGTAPRTEA